MKSNINKEDFIQILSSLSKEEINKLIEEKGKEPKLVSPVIYIK